MRALPIGGFLGAVRALVVVGTLLVLLMWAAPGATAQTGGAISPAILLLAGGGVLLALTAGVMVIRRGLTG